MVFTYSTPGIRYRVDTFSDKEPETLAWIDSFPPGAKFIDVGANVGLYSVYAARRGAQVLAIEPGPENIFALIRNVQLNHLTEQVCLCFNAVGDKDGVPTVLQQGTSDPGGARLSAFQPVDDALISWVTPGRTLDSLCAEQGFWPDFIKVDIDGNEALFLSGAQRAIRTAKQLLLETDEEGPDFTRLISRLESLGFLGIQSASADTTSTSRNLIFKKVQRDTSSR